MVLVSVIIGLGLTEIPTGAANLLRARETVRFHWIHVLMLLATPVFLFLIAHLLYPPQSEDSVLREYYYRQSPLLWGLVVAGTFEGTFLQPLVLGGPIFEIANVSGIPMVAVCFVLAMSRNVRVHSVLAPLVLFMVILDTVLANPAISVQ